jgi:hypothetical protein
MRRALSNVGRNHKDVMGKAYVGLNAKVKLRMVGDVGGGRHRRKVVPRPRALQIQRV